MAFASLKSQKGQLSIEFIMILVVILILIEVIVLPLRDYAEGSVTDIISAQTLEKNLSNLEYSAKSLQTYSAGKLSVNVKIPEDSNFFFEQSGKDLFAGYTIAMKSQDINSDAYKFCKDNVCGSKVLLLSTNATNQTFVGPQEIAFTLEKSGNTITIK